MTKAWNIHHISCISYTESMQIPMPWHLSIINWLVGFLPADCTQPHPQWCQWQWRKLDQECKPKPHLPSAPFLGGINLNPWIWETKGVNLSSSNDFFNSLRTPQKSLHFGGLQKLRFQVSSTNDTFQDVLGPQVTVAHGRQCVTAKIKRWDIDSPGWITWASRSWSVQASETPGNHTKTIRN